MNATKRVVTRVCLGVLALGLLSLTACRLPGDPQGALDSVTVDGVLNRVTVTGWAFDESDPTAPIQVHVYVDGRIQWAGRAAEYRPDVWEAYPESGWYHGYSALVVAGGVGVHNVCAFAINVGEGATNTELGCKRVSINTSANPIGGLDTAVRDGVDIFLGGWSIDPVTIDPVTIEATVNGVAVARRSARFDRPDVEGAFPGYGRARGFAVRVLVPMSQQLAAETRLCVRAIHTSAGSVTLGCRQSGEMSVSPFPPLLDQPTHLTGALASAAAIGAGTVRVTGSLVDSFDPDDTRGTYEIWVQPAHATISLYSDYLPTIPRARTAPGGGFSETIGDVLPGPTRVCLIGFMTSTAPGNLTPRTIDCRDILVT